MHLGGKFDQASDYTLDTRSRAVATNGKIVRFELWTYNIDAARVGEHFSTGKALQDEFDGPCWQTQSELLSQPFTDVEDVDCGSGLLPNDLADERHEIIEVVVALCVSVDLQHGQACDGFNAAHFGSSPATSRPVGFGSAEFRTKV
ncbi:MAG: hypothetical protein H0W20_05725 [Chthoniobacterales bacterium]|nr:hypothetical protein [Chthoniobacterales bacterium]